MYVITGLISFGMTVMNIITNKGNLTYVTALFCVLSAFDFFLAYTDKNKAVKIASFLFATEFVGMLTFFIISGNSDGFSAIWVCLEKACKFIKANNLPQFGIQHISINLSMIQLLRRSAVEKLAHICEKNGVSPKLIMFEVTETAASSTEENTGVESNVKYLKDLGFSFALDDYGTGYANIVKLLSLKFDQVKIDKSIIWESVKSKKTDVLLKYMVDTFNEFGFMCVAEGVENDEMADKLKQLGVKLFQGFKYSKPLSEDEYLCFLRNQLEKA